MSAPFSGKSIESSLALNEPPGCWWQRSRCSMGSRQWCSSCPLRTPIGVRVIEYGDAGHVDIDPRTSRAEAPNTRRSPPSHSRCLAAASGGGGSWPLVVACCSPSRGARSTALPTSVCSA